MLLRVLEWIVITVIIVGLISQVVIPMWRNLPVFPIFRRRRILEQNLRKVNELGDDAKLEAEIKDARKGARKPR